MPYSRIDLDLAVRIPFRKEFKLKITIPKFYKNHKFDGQHYWEVGKKGYSKKEVIRKIKKYFTIQKIENHYENTYHLFFMLKKK